VCDRALLIAYAGEKHIVSKKIVSKAIEDLRGSPTVDPFGWPLPGKRVGPVVLLVLFLVLIAGFAVWNLRGDIPGGLSRGPRIAELAPEKGEAGLFLNEQDSLAGLFRLFGEKGQGERLEKDNVYVGVVCLDLEPRYHSMLKRPFRIHLSGSSVSPGVSSPYILISEVTDGGAVVVNSENEEKKVPGSFILAHWGEKVSWVFPHKAKNIYLMRGMTIPEVLDVQKTLIDIGYPVELTGIYDEQTVRNITGFQKEFGLAPDGIIGPRTRALLYQMSDQYELYP